HCMLMLAVFAAAAVFIGWSGGKHSQATTDCQNDFFASSSSSSSLVNTTKEGQILCNIFSWVTFGVMAGLWFVLGIFEVMQLQLPCMFPYIDQIFRFISTS